MFKVKKGFTIIEIAIVVAIIAVIAGVWYVSKSKAGADINMPGIGNTGTTGTGGNTTPPKIGMGTIKGQVTNNDNSPAGRATISILMMNAGCKWGYKGAPPVFTSVTADNKGFYRISSVPPRTYCVVARGETNVSNGDWSSKIEVVVGKSEIKTVDIKLNTLPIIPSPIPNPN